MEVTKEKTAKATDPYEAALDLLLETPSCPTQLRSMQPYVRLHDDHDGTNQGTVMVTIGPDGDTWLNIDNPEGMGLRFRNFFGGGASLRTHAALLILAEAIRRDNEARR